MYPMIPMEETTVMVEEVVKVGEVMAEEVMVEMRLRSMAVDGP